jgi:hypothetical protein
MKKLFIAFTLVGLITACDSNKKSSNAGSYSSAPKPKTANTNSVSRVNEPAEILVPKTHMDSVLMYSDTEKNSSYNSSSTYHNGVSGVGSGSSYAGHAYAKLRYKKKPKAVKKAVPPMEQEVSDNLNNTDSLGTLKKDSASGNNGW